MSLGLAIQTFLSQQLDIVGRIPLTSVTPYDLHVTHSHSSCDNVDNSTCYKLQVQIIVL